MAALGTAGATGGASGGPGEMFVTSTGKTTRVANTYQESIRSITSLARGRGEHTYMLYMFMIMYSTVEDE